MIDHRIALACLAVALAGPAASGRAQDVDEAAQARLDAPVTLHFPEETPLAQVLDAIKAAAADGLKVEVGPGAREKVKAATVTVDVEGIPLKAAMTQVVRRARLIYTVKDSTATIGVDTYKDPDPKELEGRMKPVDSTVYAPRFDEAKFRAIRPGMAEAEVHKLIGNPLRETRSRPQVDWYYGPPTLRVTEDGGMFDTSGEIANAWGYTIARAHPDGKIFEFLGGYFPEVPRELIGADLAEMKKRYGEPVAVHAIQATRYLVYAAPKASGSYRTRVVGVDAAGKVVEVVAGYYFD